METSYLTMHRLCLVWFKIDLIVWKLGGGIMKIDETESFKIDLIVWKPVMTEACELLLKQFKIDLIVWKLDE